MQQGNLYNVDDVFQKVRDLEFKLEELSSSIDYIESLIEQHHSIVLALLEGIEMKEEANSDTP